MSLLRDIVGFLVGGIVGAAAAGLSFSAVYSPPPIPAIHDHHSEAVVLLGVILFFGGGFIGSRAFSADLLSGLYVPIALTYTAAIGLTLMATGEFLAAAIMAGFATVGVVASAGISLLMRRFFPPPGEALEGT